MLPNRAILEKNSRTHPATKRTSYKHANILGFMNDNLLSQSLGNPSRAKHYKDPAEHRFTKSDFSLATKRSWICSQGQILAI